LQTPDLPTGMRPNEALGKPSRIYRNLASLCDSGGSKSEPLMRKGRFASLRNTRPDAVEPLSVGALLRFDFIAAEEGQDERVGIERVRTLTHSAMFLILIHALCGSLLLLAALKLDQYDTLLPLGAPIAVLLLLDFGFWRVTQRKRTLKLKPHIVLRLSALYALAAGILWSLLVPTASAELAEVESAQLALFAGFLLLAPAFFSIPAIVVGTCFICYIAAAAFFSENPMLLGSVALIGGCLSWFSIYSARDALISAQRRLIAEWEASKATRFVSMFEQSGRGWFWETDADGRLTYVSEQLAKDLRRPASSLLNVQFAELLLVQSGDGEEPVEQSLKFHLTARFPFSDVTVRANSDENIWWSLSGSPTFDEYGRFLGFRGIGTDLTEQRRNEEEIARLARYDSLTGLPNRSLMRLTLEEAVRNAAKRRSGCSLFLIDLDRFKNVNDTLGHPVGDALLRQVAQRLSKVIGDSGQVGRLGGDEFKAVLPGIDDQGTLASLAEQLIQQVSMPYVIDGHNVSIGASVGIAIASPRGACADALIRDADLALYAAKDKGRGTYCFFEPEMHSEATDRQLLENDLRVAVDRSELQLLFQPIVNAITEEVVAFEALVRWLHPQRGSIPPSVFIPLAEECGLIVRIGEWVLRQACAEAVKWPSHIGVAVNLSPIQFAHAALPAVIGKALGDAGLDPERLELEITESVFVADSPQTDERFTALKEIGVRLVLDDFGIGYSSLGYLKTAPFDKIKIDQSFVRGAATVTSRNAAIVRAIVAMAESMGMDTTAEGVETAEEITLIRELGCSQVQGHVFGRPMPAHEAQVIAAQSEEHKDDGRSRAPRHGLIRLATLRWNGKSFPVRLRNISEGGALLESERELPKGTEVQLDLPGCGTLSGEVRWSQTGRLGMRFAQPFDLRKLAPPKKAAAGARMLRPEYLKSEVDPNSPWAGRHERLTPAEVRRL
jgi:diguanylate cyclase (GGDEF)-like protein